MTLAAPACLDPLAPAHPGRWEHGDVTVCREQHEGLLPRVLSTQQPSLRTPHFRVHRTGHRLVVLHRLHPADLGESLVPMVVTELSRAGALVRREEFELVLTGLVCSTVDDPVAAWVTYYRNSMTALADGSAAFAPVHTRAAELVVGTTLLDLGSCFGFFPLRMAGAGLQVTATDLCAGTTRLLGTVARQLRVGVDTLTCDAAAVPLPDGCADTVSALHLLEHLEPEHGRAVLDEALRLARRRVVIAVPFEDQASDCYGHVRTFTADSLAALAQGRGTVTEHHGGWLVLDR